MIFETTMNEQILFLERLVKESVFSEMCVSIQWRKSEKTTTPSVDITFFKGDINFTVSLYYFRTVKKNKGICNKCIELLKNPKLFEDMKEWSSHV